jgi:leader peptidase (prepilin peptidase) / N-methyltransferase
MTIVPPGALAAVVLGVLGLMVGSFANVVIYRVPAGRSIISPPSACPKCAVQLKPWDNVPVFSWLVLKGRCRNCLAPISPRYPLVEGLVGLVFAFTGLRFGLGWTSVGEAVLGGALVILGFIDFDHMLLPRKIVYITLGIVAAIFVAGAAAGDEWHRLLIATIAGLVPFALFFAINFVSPRALGFGDVRLALLMGFGLGWLSGDYAFLGFVLASILGSLVGVGLMMTGKAGRKTLIPFGSFLAAGAILAALAGGPVVNWYSGLIH